MHCKRLIPSKCGLGGTPIAAVEGKKSFERSIDWSEERGHTSMNGYGNGRYEERYWYEISILSVRVCNLWFIFLYG